MSKSYHIKKYGDDQYMIYVDPNKNPEEDYIGIIASKEGNLVGVIAEGTKEKYYGGVPDSSDDPNGRIEFDKSVDIMIDGKSCFINPPPVENIKISELIKAISNATARGITARGIIASFNAELMHSVRTKPDGEFTVAFEMSGVLDTPPEALYTTLVDFQTRRMTGRLNQISDVFLAAPPCSDASPGQGAAS